jgi:hypothetical protein
MKKFSLTRIKNIEREPKVFGLPLGHAAKWAVISVIAFFYFLVNPSWINAGIVGGIIFGSLMLIKSTYDLGFFISRGDEKHPEQIINTIEE